LDFFYFWAAIPAIIPSPRYFLCFYLARQCFRWSHAALKKTAKTTCGLSMLSGLQKTLSEKYSYFLIH
jgi:hypothetical protein